MSIMGRREHTQAASRKKGRNSTKWWSFDAWYALTAYATPTMGIERKNIIEKATMKRVFVRKMKCCDGKLRQFADIK